MYNTRRTKPRAGQCLCAMHQARPRVLLIEGKKDDPFFLASLIYSNVMQFSFSKREREGKKSILISKQNEKYKLQRRADARKVYMESRNKSPWVLTENR